jgi:hypothetical protein
MPASRRRPKHDPNEGARYVVTAYRAAPLGLAPVTCERDTLPDARGVAERLMRADLDGDCYVAVEVLCVRGDASAICFAHTRGESELRLRRALLNLRRSAT